MRWRTMFGYLVALLGVALFVAGWLTELFLPWTQKHHHDSPATPLAPLIIFVGAVLCSRVGRALAKHFGWLMRPLPAIAIWVALTVIPAPEGDHCHWLFARFFFAMFACIQLIASGLGMTTGRSAVAKYIAH